MVVDVKWHQRHDYFNLAVLPIVCAATIYYLSVDCSLYMVQYHVFLWYMVFDTVWLVLVPNSVASPGTIIAHHAVCLVGWNIPVFFDYRYAELLSLGPLVEINTWFLIARRNFKGVHVLNLLFHTTWVALRMIMYPVVLVLFVLQYAEESREFQTWLHAGFLVLVLMVVINILNLKWSVDLYSKTGQSAEPRDHRKGL